jgi:hypothetical protein
VSKCNNDYAFVTVVLGGECKYLKQKDVKLVILGELPKEEGFAKALRLLGVKKAAPAPAPVAASPPPASPSPGASAPAKKCYYKYWLIPLHGDFGETIQADTVCEHIDNAAKSRDAVVFSIDSAGGFLPEIEKILDVMHKHRSRLQFVTVVRKASGVAAAIPLACDFILMEPAAVLGGPDQWPGSKRSGDLDVETRLTPKVAASLKSGRSFPRPEYAELLDALARSSSTSVGSSDAASHGMLAHSMRRSFSGPDRLKGREVNQWRGELSALLEERVRSDCKAPREWKEKLSEAAMAREARESEDFLRRCAMRKEWASSMRSLIAAAKSADPYKYHDYSDSNPNRARTSRRKWDERSQAASQNWQAAREVGSELLETENQAAGYYKKQVTDMKQLSDDLEMCIRNISLLGSRRGSTGVGERRPFRW